MKTDARTTPEKAAAAHGRFDQWTAALAADPRVRRMQAFDQHGDVSTYDHCLAVVRMSVRIDRRLRLGSDRRALARGAMLHDYFLYDWHAAPTRLHGFFHPARALANAERDFALSDRERDIIASHMWPLTFWQIPKSREAWVVCAADKLCALSETLARFWPGLGGKDNEEKS